MTLRLLLVTLLGASAALAADIPSRLTNVSVRSSAGAGAETLIVGFAIGGTGTKPVLLRGIGPSLGAFGVAGAVADPQFRLYNSSGTLLSENDDWGGAAVLANAFAAVGAFPLAANSRDAALLVSLPAGSYSGHLITGAAGIGLIECYDTENGSAATTIRNVSARSVAGTGADVLTVGFAIAGATSKTVLIRGVGATLASFGVAGTVADPQLRLYNSASRLLNNNNDWGGSTGYNSVFTSVGAFSLPATSRDSVLLVTLVPGTYTAQVSGVANTTGVALIEVYEVPGTPPVELTQIPVQNPIPPAGSNIVSKLDVAARVLTQARPVYPFEMRRGGIEGQALILFTSKADGTVGDAMVTIAADMRFGEAALAAVRQWTFAPGQSGGRAVDSRLLVPIVFTLTSN